MAVREATIQKLREKFAKREAIFLYKGAALRVRVMSIRWADDLITADLEEVPTAGFELQWLRSQLCLCDQQDGASVLVMRWSFFRITSGLSPMGLLCTSQWPSSKMLWNLLRDGPGICRVSSDTMRFAGT